MSEDWKTKYGTRRVRHDPPTLDEAIFAAQGITDDLEGQVDIAASLMGVPEDKVREQIAKFKPAPMPLNAIRPTRTISTERSPQRAIVVERRGVRRPMADKRPTT